MTRRIHDSGTELPSGCIALALLVLAMTAACGGGGQSSMSSQQTTTPTAPSLTVTSISNTSPLPLTPLQISTSGLSASGTITVAFSNSSGYSFSEQPIRVTSSAIVVAAVPLYSDPTTGQIGPGTVSLVVSQGSASSASTTLNIQDLPSVSSYGVQPGQISHAFFVYQAMRIAQRIGELQAFQNLPSNTVNTTQAQNNLNSLLSAVITARSDIDNVTLNSALINSGGTLPGGTPIQFDQYSLDLMDRVIGLYLNSEMSTVISTANLIKSSTPRRTVRLGGYSIADSFVGVNRQDDSLHREFGSTIVPAVAFSGGCTSTSAMCGIINFISTATNLTGITQAYADLFSTQGQSSLDPILAVGGGLSAFYGLADNVGLSNQAGPFLGAIVSSVALLQNFGMELGDLAFIIVASQNGTDPSVIAQAQADIQQQGSQAWINTLQAEFSLAEIGEYAESVVAMAALQSAEFVTAAYNCATTGCLNVVQTAATQVASEVTSVFTSATEGFAELTGVADISNSAGPILSAETGIEFGPFNGVNEVTALADQGGNYEFFVPLDSPNTVYSSLTTTAFDPISQQAIASETIDLSGWLTINIGELPTMQGTCNDTDATDPDSDDPDCD